MWNLCDIDDSGDSKLSVGRARDMANYNVVKSVRGGFSYDVVQIRDGGEIRSICSCQNVADAYIIVKLLGIFEEQIQESQRERNKS